MAHAYHHALSSARRYGGDPEDYLALHHFLDSSKVAWGDQRHRAVLHHSFGIYVAEQLFGAQEEVRLLRRALARVPQWLQRLLRLPIPATTPVTLTLRSGKQVPIRLVAEQHVKEDCGFVPSVEAYLRTMPAEPWMRRGTVSTGQLLGWEPESPPLAPPPTLSPTASGPTP
jgi:hypothetical protein